MFGIRKIKGKSPDLHVFKNCCQSSQVFIKGSKGKEDILTDYETIKVRSLKHPQTNKTLIVKQLLGRDRKLKTVDY